MRISYWSSDVCSSDLDSFPVSGAPCKRIGSTKSLQYAGEARVVAQRGKIGIVFDPGTVAPAEVNGALEQFEGTIDYAETGERAGGVVDDECLGTRGIECALDPLDGELAVAELGEDGATEAQGRAVVRVHPQVLFEDHLRPGHRFVGAVRASHRLVRLAEEAERAVIRWIDLRRMLEQSGGLFHVSSEQACPAGAAIGREQ